MLLCFVLYIISFILYYLAYSFLLLAIASFVFRLGEAFRLGTHKVIIFDYLDWRGITVSMMNKGTGSLFDPEIVEVFIYIVR